MTRTSLRVRVPASTSNLGPGFDLLGLALSLWLEVEVEVGGEAHEFVALEGTARDWPRTGNLLLQAFDAGARACGVEPPALQVSARSEIPIGRGLGSSGAAVAAGLALAASLPDAALDAGDLCALGCELEGHPDNCTASLMGGCTLALPHLGDGLGIVHQELHPGLGFAVAWPASQLATAEARRALPDTVPFADAVENPRRLAFLLEGLRRGDPHLLGLGIEDRLHVRHRLALLPGAEAALAAAGAQGAWAATVSGSGSALIALGAAGAMEPVAAAMAAALDDSTRPAVGRVVEPVLEAPRVERVV